MNDRTATSHTPDLTFQWNGGRAPITIARVAVGQYQVTIPGLSTSGQGVGEHVQVSPYGGSNSSGSTYVKDFSSIYFAPLSSQATQQISGYVQLGYSQITTLK